MRCISGTITEYPAVGSEEEFKAAKTESREDFYRRQRAEQLARVSETVRPTAIEPCVHGFCSKIIPCGTTCGAAVLLRVQAALAELDGAPA